MPPFLKPCLVAASTLALTACVRFGKEKTTAPLLTCAPGTVELMKKLGLEPGQQGSLQLEASQPGGPTGYGVYRPGRVTSRLESAVGELTAGTLVSGVLWMDTGKVQVRYTQASLPDGQSYPVCLVLGASAPGGVYAEAGTTPRAITLPKSLPFTVVAQFE
jgi:serine/threonine-protein kinase